MYAIRSYYEQIQVGQFFKQGCTVAIVIRSEQGRVHGNADDALLFQLRQLGVADIGVDNRNSFEAPASLLNGSKQT